MKTKTANRLENVFIKECNDTDFNLSIPAKITNSNKPFIYFYWPNKLKGGNLDRARKGGVGGVNSFFCQKNQQIICHLPYAFCAW